MSEVFYGRDMNLWLFGFHLFSQQQRLKSIGYRPPPPPHDSQYLSRGQIVYTVKNCWRISTPPCILLPVLVFWTVYPVGGEKAATRAAENCPTQESWRTPKISPPSPLRGCYFFYRVYSDPLSPDVPNFLAPRFTFSYPSSPPPQKIKIYVNNIFFFILKSFLLCNICIFHPSLYTAYRYFFVCLRW